MQEVDLHGKTREDIARWWTIFCHNMQEQGGGQVRVITGKGMGIVSDEVRALCAEDGIEYEFEEGNSGALILTFEGRIDYEEDWSDIFT